MSPVVQISILMFLKYFITGSYYGTMGLVFGTHGLGAYVGIAYSIGGFTTLSTNMLAGEIADRFIKPNTMLFYFQIVSASALLLIPAQITAGHVGLLLLLMVVNSAFGESTLSVCSRIAFHVLESDLREYSISRAIGTFGWLAAGLAIGFGGISASVAIFQIAGVVSFLLAAYVLTLPSTPASGRRDRIRLRDVIGWDALAMMSNRSLLVFVLVAVAIFIPMSAYNAYLPLYLHDNHVSNVGGLMTLAQATEMLLLFSLAYFIRLLGIRNILGLACCAWVVILVLFAVANQVSLALIIVAILLHGLGWDFFYASSEVYLNQKTPEALKARGQTLLRTATFGLGTILGSLLCGAFYNSLQAAGSPPTGAHWPLFWGTISLVPFALVFTVFLFFREDNQSIKLSLASIPMPIETQPIE